jgi:hypothetical protein
MMWLVLVFLLPLVDAYIFKTEFQVGTYTGIFIYDNETVSESRVVLSHVNFTTSTVYFQTVYSNSTSSSFACRQISQQQIAVGPDGCSNIISPESALQSANCITNSVDAANARDVFELAWFYSRYSSDCILAGCTRGARCCMGPPRFAMDDARSFLPYQQMTVKMALATRSVGIAYNMGPFAMLPVMMFVDFVYPEITVNTTCNNTNIDVSFNGSYSNIETDNTQIYITTIWKAFVGPNAALRLLLKRTANSDTSFRLILANYPSVSTSEPYDYVYQSEIILDPVDTYAGLRKNWIDLITFDTAYVMYEVSSGVATCNMTLSIPSTLEYVIQDPDVPTVNNYYQNKDPPPFYYSRVCSWCSGRVDADRNLVYPDTPDGSVCGGDALFVDPASGFLPIGIPANPNLAFDLDCVKFYPVAATFLDYAGQTLSRIDISVSQKCYAPFVLTELVTAGTDIGAKGKQCFFLGGYLSFSELNCERDITKIHCQKDYIYAGQRCFYKFDPLIDAQFAVPIDQADTKCGELSPFVSALVEVDQVLQEWLRTSFISWKKNINQRAAYRIPRFGPGVKTSALTDTCNCFLTETLTIILCPCFAIEIEVDSEVLPIFPICYYKQSEPEMEPEYVYVGMSYKTATVLVNGQIGPKPGGFAATCSCYGGFGDKNCNMPTCPLSHLLVQGGSDLSLVVRFFQKCTAFATGYCDNGQPRICQCVFGYGPAASILSTHTALYPYRDIPCNCPTAAGGVQAFQVNLNVYNESVGPPVCGGVFQGVCITTNATTLGYCVCLLRPNLVEGGFESAFDGLACTSIIPIQPFNADVKNGPIIASLCNNHGVSCPGGRSIENPTVGNMEDKQCFDKFNGDALDGCSCDNGWIGASCTCPRPFDYAAISPVLRRESGSITYLYVDMGQRYNIQIVNVTLCGTVTAVWVSNEVGKPSVSELCVYNASRLLYECDPVVNYRFVYLVGATYQEYCTIQAYTQDYIACGRNETVNPYSYRFLDIAEYWGPAKFILDQPLGLTLFGCTSTECMCNSNFGGKECGLGVSSIRDVEIERDGVTISTQAKLYCGESTLVPDETNPVASRGKLDPITLECDCASISNVDNTGRSGTVVERFTRDACECAEVQNLDTQEVVMCADNGECVERDFPYGFCELDLDDFENDPLSEPYEQFTVFSDDEVLMQVVDDVYLIFDYAYPTSSPTSSPTNSPTSPTKSPTSSPTSPTNSPTVSVDILIFDSGVTGSGTAPTNPSVCAPVTPPTCNPSTVYQFRSITGLDLRDLPYPATADVKGPTGGVIGTWTNIFDGSIDQSLFAVGIPANLVYWTGTTSAGSAWTTSSPTPVNGFVGFSPSTNPTWITSTILGCNNNGAIICSCEVPRTTPTKSPTVPTKSPTASPTRSPTVPTNSPTTGSPTVPTGSPTTGSPTAPTSSPTIPTKSPTSSTNVLIFGSASPVTGSGPTSPDILCAPVSPPTCNPGTIYQFRSITGLDMRDIPYPATANVLGPSGGSIGTWTNIFDGDIDQSLNSVGISTSPSFWWTGSTSAGVLSPTTSCTGWTTDSPSPSVSGSLGSQSSTTPTWITNSGGACNNARSVLCVCEVPA